MCAQVSGKCLCVCTSEGFATEGSNLLDSLSSHGIKMVRGCWPSVFRDCPWNLKRLKLKRGCSISIC